MLQDVPKCRQWAGQVGNQAKYHPPLRRSWTRRLDAVFLHPIAGPLIFVAVVIAVFQTIFSYADPLMDGMKWLFDVPGAWIAQAMPEGVIRSLLMEGVWKGVGSVIVFLPQMLLLFLFIGILEDSGYLARAALIADRTMARVGLQGKSFIPLLSAYACAVPAILATRTIENKRDRFATILIAPFMTCSARLPVYTLIIAAFIPDRHLLGRLLSTQAAAMLGLYILGFLAAVADGTSVEIVDSEERPHAVPAGDAIVPLAHGTVSGPASAGSREGLPAPRRDHHPAGDRTAVDLRPSARGERQSAPDRPQPGRHHGPHHRAGHQAAGLQLEDRDRTDYFSGSARDPGRHPRQYLRHGRQ